MSILFFDQLNNFEEIELTIKNKASSKEEKEELWGLVEGIVNHKVFEKILDKLPETNHEEFLMLFHKCPYDEVAVFGYLDKKIGRDIKKELENDLKSISSDVIRELRPEDEIGKETQISKK